MAKEPPDLTVLFARLRAGEREALGSIMDALYTELRALASRRMRDETGRHTLQPTALVNEAYLRLIRGPLVINDRHHFFALAAKAMRNVLCDHARQKYADKRGGRRERVTLDLVPGLEAVDIDLLALDEALLGLSKLDPRAAQVVELRFFGGHTDKEVSAIIGTSIPAIRRDWTFARSWLKTHLKPVATA
jgi:RNA polymerase sigma factor (TIGR02999 family)